MIDPVPSNIRIYRGDLLVPLLTGFPFPVGGAEVRRVDKFARGMGSSEPFITGLTMAIDVLPVTTPGRGDSFYVLEFSAAPLANAPGRLRRFNSPTATPVVVADSLISPTSVAHDPASGDFFITEFFTGRIIRVQGA